MATPQAQWDLTRTGASLISITSDIIRATTSDNVQTLALIACERFGATLAICPATCEKVEREIIKIQNRTTRVVGFLQSAVGYSKGDCASQLATSLAGIQFIGLAAALVPSIGAYHGGQALALMLKSSALDKTLLPPARHLKDLLASLEHRCVQLGFANLILFWTGVLCNSPSTSAEDREFWKIAKTAPDAVGLNKLVEAFRDLSRIGDAASITIESASCTPWIVAFIQWCIGVPPIIYLEDGRLLWEESKSRITCIARHNSPEISFGFKLSVHKSLNNPAELITTEEVISTDGSSSYYWSGMVTIERYGQWLLREYDFDIGIASRAITEALPYCLKQVVTLLRLSILAEYDRSKPPKDWQGGKPGRSITNPTLLGMVARPFPRDRIIASMLSRVLNSSTPLELQPLADGLLISDLPLMKLYFKDIKETCGCEKCEAPAPPNKYKLCKKKVMMDALSSIVAEVLTLSLYDFPEQLLVQLDRRSSGIESLNSAVFQILSTGKPTLHPFRGVLETALSIVGHDISEKLKNRWVMSCYKGQAVYPRLFETNRLEDDGFLTLSWAPGLLRHQDEIYKEAVEPLARNGVPAYPPAGNTEVTSSCNLFPDNALTWRITMADDLLEVSVSVLDPSGKFRRSSLNPTQSLTNLTSALIVRACPHAANSRLAHADPFCEYTHYLEPTHSQKARDDSSTVCVVPVDGNDGLRMISFASSGSYQCPFVLRDGACLSCCLDVCRRAGYLVVVC